MLKNSKIVEIICLLLQGRNVPEVLLMMQHIENYNKSLVQKQSESIDDSNKIFPITISVELEKVKPELLDLLPYADIAFVSKDFAKSRGYINMSETLKSISEGAKTGLVLYIQINISFYFLFKNL